MKKNISFFLLFYLILPGKPLFAQLNLEKSSYIQNFDAIKVFDNAGCVVYSKQGYTNGWNGTSNNGALSQGAYYYLIDFGAGLGLLKGYITKTRD